MVAFFWLAAPSTDLQPLPYLGQEPPGAAPKVFAPDWVSNPDVYEYGSVFSADGLEFFYGVNVGKRAEIRTLRWEGDAWSKPEVLVAAERFSFGDPFLSPDEQRLYFISNRPLTEEESTPKDYDIWYLQRQPEGWSEPINLGPPINSNSDEYYISFTSSGRIYFASNRSGGEDKRNFDLYAADPEQDRFKTPFALPGDVNTPRYEADAYVAPDESFVIFGSNRRSGKGQGDLYISLRDEDGNWSDAKPLGSGINTEGHELCPFVTTDGRFFFYTSNEEIYWVDASVLDAYRGSASPAKSAPPAVP